MGRDTCDSHGTWHVTWPTADVSCETWEMRHETNMSRDTWDSHGTWHVRLTWAVKYPHRVGTYYFPPRVSAPVNQSHPMLYKHLRGGQTGVSNKWCVYWDTVRNSNEFQGRTILRHSSWLKWMACVLRHNSVFRCIPAPHNSDTQFVTQMHGVAGGQDDKTRDWHQGR